MIAGVCLAWAAATGAAAAPPAEPLFVPTPRFTLAWTHSIEKQRWEEDYQVRLTTTAQGHTRAVLHAVAARIRGSGAGMEPPPDARLRRGWYEYTPADQTPELLRLSRSAFTADYEWCVEGRCRPLSALLPSDGGVTEVRPCARTTPP